MDTRDLRDRSQIVSGPERDAAWAPTASARGTGRERGQSTVEFALILPFMCALVLLLVDFGKAMAYWINTTQVANEGARAAAVNAPGISNFDTFLRGELDGELRGGSINVPGTGATVSICYPDGTSKTGDPVKVTVAASYKPTLVPFLGSKFKFLEIPLVGSATMRLERDVTNPALSGGSC